MLHDVLKRRQLIGRLPWIHGAQSCQHTFGQRLSRQAGPYDKFSSFRSRLRNRQIDFRPCSSLQAGLPDVRNYAHHLGRLTAIRNTILAKRIGSRPEMPGCRFIEDDDTFESAFWVAILPCEVASLTQLHSHRREITGRDDPDQGGVEITLCRGMFFRPELPVAVPAQGKHVRDSSGMNARDFLYLTEHLLKYDASGSS